jgi:hypothetical protein
VGATNPVTSVAMLLICAFFVAPACAQEPTQPNLLLQLSRPAQSVPIDSTTRDDIQDRPAPPRADPLREPFRIYVGVGDPRCFPGENGLSPGRIGGGTRRRSH